MTYASQAKQSQNSMKLVNDIEFQQQIFNFNTRILRWAWVLTIFMFERYPCLKYPSNWNIYQRIKVQFGINISVAKIYDAQKSTSNRTSIAVHVVLTIYYLHSQPYQRTSENHFAKQMNNFVRFVSKKRWHNIFAKFKFKWPIMSHELKQVFNWSNKKIQTALYGIMHHWKHFDRIDTFFYLFQGNFWCVLLQFFFFVCVRMCSMSWSLSSDHPFWRWIIYILLFSVKHVTT